MKKYMNLKTLESILKLWMGYILVKNSVVGTYIPLETLGMPQHIYQIMKGMWDTGFMMHIVKLIELIGGLMLIFHFKNRLAIILLAPVVFNIYGVHIFLFNSFFTNGLWMSLILILMVYRRRSFFKQLLL